MGGLWKAVPWRACQAATEAESRSLDAREAGSCSLKAAGAGPHSLEAADAHAQVELHLLLALLRLQRLLAVPAREVGEAPQHAAAAAGLACRPGAHRRLHEAAKAGKGTPARGAGLTCKHGHAGQPRNGEGGEASGTTGRLPGLTAGCLGSNAMPLESVAVR